MSTQTDEFTTNFIQLIVFLTLNFICISALLKFVYSHHDIKLDSSVALLKNLEACSTVILIMYLLKINLITILLLFNTVVILPYHTSPCQAMVSFFHGLLYIINVLYIGHTFYYFISFFPRRLKRDTFLPFCFSVNAKVQLVIYLRGELVIVVNIVICCLFSRTTLVCALMPKSNPNTGRMRSFPRVIDSS
jgi:hypothetical protein